MKNKYTRSQLTVFIKTGILISLVFFCAGCATGNHGTFSETTFFDKNKYSNFHELGDVRGESCQAIILYVFPYENPPSTMEALDDAMDEYDSTVFIGNVSIETRTEWLVGYSKVCTLVTGTAYSAKEKGNP